VEFRFITRIGDQTSLSSLVIIHEDDDQVVPIIASAIPTSKLVKYSILKTYAGGSHGLANTSKDQLNAYLLDFLKSLIMIH
jgi:non-heme chloroperoxidase